MNSKTVCIFALTVTLCFFCTNALPLVGEEDSDESGVVVLEELDQALGVVGIGGGQIPNLAAWKDIVQELPKTTFFEIIPIASERNCISLISTSQSLRGPRHRRVTCDLLSPSIQGNQLNHSACAANCLIQGFKGGYCNNGVCHCRR